MMANFGGAMPAQPVRDVGRSEDDGDDSDSDQSSEGDDSSRSTSPPTTPLDKHTPPPCDQPLPPDEYGYVFVLLCDITKLNCDYWLGPTGAGLDPRKQPDFPRTYRYNKFTRSYYYDTNKMVDMRRAARKHSNSHSNRSGATSSSSSSSSSGTSGPEPVREYDVPCPNNPGRGWWDCGYMGTLQSFAPWPVETPVPFMVSLHVGRGKTEKYLNEIIRFVRAAASHAR